MLVIPEQIFDVTVQSVGYLGIPEQIFDVIIQSVRCAGYPGANI